MPTSAKTEQPSALLVIDIQNDYFPGGAMALAEPEAAGRPVFHIRHEAARPGATFFLPGTPGADIHAGVAPLSGETVILKHWPNSFRDTGLGAALAACGAKRLAVAGMMTHMCVDATVRAAFDLGYAVTVAADACATRELAYGGRTVAAADVQAAFLAALGAVYAEVAATAEVAV